MDIHIIFAKISWVLLITILMMRPLGEILNWKFFLSKLHYRKQLGIVCGIAALLHVTIYLVENNLLGVYFTNPSFWSFKNLFGWGNIALLAMLPPLLTSNKASQRFFKKYWKSLQKFSYPTFIFTGIHIALSRNELIFGLLPVAIWAIIWSWAKIKKASKSKSSAGLFCN